MAVPLSRILSPFPHSLLSALRVNVILAKLDKRSKGEREEWLLGRVNGI